MSINDENDINQLYGCGGNWLLVINRFPINNSQKIDGRNQMHLNWQFPFVKQESNVNVKS